MELKDLISPLTFAISLFVVIRHFRYTKTLEAIEYFSSGPLLDIRWSLDKWLERPMSDEERLLELESNEERAKEMRYLLIGLTNIGASYKYNLLNRKQVRDIWEHMLLRYYEQIRFYVNHRRARGRAVGFLFEEMVHSLDRSRNPYKPLALTMVGTTAYRRD